MRVMVTGGLGMNGAWLVRELLGQGHEVAVFENREDLSLVEDVAERIELVVGDIRDTGQLTGAVSALRPECVVHLAAFVDCERDPHTAIAVNVGGTAQVCAAAVAAGARRVVYTSSKAVYGPTTGKRGFPTYEPISEEDDRRPRGMYDITKTAAEDVLNWYGRTTHLECVSLRFSTIYGPGKLQRHGVLAGFGQQISTYSSMVELPASGRPFALDHGGDERDDLLYVLDVADAIACVVSAPRFHHHAYNVSSGWAISLGEFADAIRRVIPEAVLDVGPGLNPMDAKESAYMVLDRARMEEEFGWCPRYDPDRAIRHYHDHVKARRS